jgi:hypothetical protein
MAGMTNRAPLITAIVLLLLPALYVGSYLALVVPKGATYEFVPMDPKLLVGVSEVGFTLRKIHYRTGSGLAERLYWPLEQIDRKLRPGAWE